MSTSAPTARARRAFRPRRRRPTRPCSACCCGTARSSRSSPGTATATGSRRIPALGGNGYGFWEIVTSAHTDWPQQSRLLRLDDNLDGSLSLHTHVIEHSAPPRPKRVRSTRRGVLSAAEVSRLASIARELSFNNPDAENGEDGFADRRGTRLDRNVELVVRNPY